MSVCHQGSTHSNSVERNSACLRCQHTNRITLSVVMSRRRLITIQNGWTNPQHGQHAPTVSPRGRVSSAGTNKERSSHRVPAMVRRTFDIQLPVYRTKISS
ncbi:hypothetical protein BD413DRAFT_273752 [Trametes elegans]|nr:hypothetical protein BD413DRAFT_273752 [Trametes elegans]